MSGNGWVKELISWSPVPPDKLVHCGIYFCLAGLMANFIGRWTRSKRILAPATFAVTMFYGLLDEGLQAFVPTRTPDFYDLVADAIGSFLGTTVFHLQASLPTLSLRALVADLASAGCA